MNPYESPAMVEEEPGHWCFLCLLEYLWFLWLPPLGLLAGGAVVALLPLFSVFAWMDYRESKKRMDFVAACALTAVTPIWALAVVHLWDVWFYGRQFLS